MVLIDFIGKKGRNTCVVKNKKIRNNLLIERINNLMIEYLYMIDEIKSNDVNEY